MTVKEVLKFELTNQKHILALNFLQSELRIWVNNVGRPVTDRKCVAMAEAFETLLYAEDNKQQISVLREELKYAKDEHGC